MYNVLKTVVSFCQVFLLFPITPFWPESEVIFYFKPNKHLCFNTFSDNSNIRSLGRSVSLIRCFYYQILITVLFPYMLISDYHIKIIYEEDLLLLGRSVIYIFPIPPTDYN